MVLFILLWLCMQKLCSPNICWCKIIQFCELQRKNDEKIFTAHRNWYEFVVFLFMFLVHHHALDMSHINISIYVDLIKNDQSIARFKCSKMWVLLTPSSSTKPFHRYHHSQCILIVHHPPVTSPPFGASPSSLPPPTYLSPCQLLHDLSSHWRLARLFSCDACCCMLFS